MRRAPTQRNRGWQQLLHGLFHESHFLFQPCTVSYSCLVQLECQAIFMAAPLVLEAVRSAAAEHVMTYQAITTRAQTLVVQGEPGMYSSDGGMLALSASRSADDYNRY